MKAPNSSKVGMAVIVIAFLSLAQLLYFSYSARVTAQCQADVNQAFLDTLKQRAAISDGDRANIRQLVTDLVDPKANDQASIEAYYERDRQLEALRNSFQYPDIKGSCG